MIHVLMDDNGLESWIYEEVQLYNSLLDACTVNAWALLS